MKNKTRILHVAQNTLTIEHQAIEKLKAQLDDVFCEAILKIHQSGGRLIVTGVGKSALIATKIVATLNSTGTPSIFMHAADAVHGDLGIIQKGDIVLCLSKSGNTEEIKVLVPFIRKAGNLLIGVTADPSSFLGTSSDLCLHTPVDQEACPHNLAPTTSTTLQLALGDALAMCLLDLKDFNAVDFAKYHPGGSLGKKLYLKVDDLLKHHDKPQVKATSSIKAVIQEITEKRLGATAVMDGQKVVGIITDGDLRRMLENTPVFTDLKAQDIMTPNPKTIDHQQLAVDALSQMESMKINHFVVTNAHGDYQGIVHILDFIREGIRS